MPPNEVIMRVTSPGGTVTGYGLASAEMKRLTKAGIKLTVCIDQLAASGGYLMACVADQIFASPYAAIGSIGVVAQQPNFAERLDREGIEFITTTAGKWKRTVTPFSKPSEEDLAKQKEDIKMVYVQFADTVKRNRPHLDIDQVSVP
jgi:ClpP class serine protease